MTKASNALLPELSVFNQSPFSEILQIRPDPEKKTFGEKHCAPRSSAKYCDQRACLSLCLSARMSRKPHVQTSQNFLYMLPVAVVQSSSDGSVARYVLLWMTSCFLIIGRKARSISNISVDTMLWQVVETSIVFTRGRHAVWLSSRTVAANCSVMIILPLVLHPFNGLFSRKTWVSRHQIGKPLWILLEQEIMGRHCHQLEHMRIIAPRSR